MYFRSQLVHIIINYKRTSIVYLKIIKYIVYKENYNKKWEKEIIKGSANYDN